MMANFRLAPTSRVVAKHSFRDAIAQETSGVKRGNGARTSIRDWDEWCGIHICECAAVVATTGSARDQQAR